MGGGGGTPRTLGLKKLYRPRDIFLFPSTPWKNNYILGLVHAYQGIFYDVYRFLGGEGPSPRRGRDRDDEGGGTGARARSSRDPAG